MVEESGKSGREERVNKGFWVTRGRSGDEY